MKLIPQSNVEVAIRVAKHFGLPEPVKNELNIEEIRAWLKTTRAILNNNECLNKCQTDLWEVSIYLQNSVKNFIKEEVDVKDIVVAFSR